MSLGLFESFFPVLASALDAYIRIFPIDLVRYLMGAGGVYLVVNVLLRRRLAPLKIRAIDPMDGQKQREFITSLGTVMIFALNGTFIFLFMEAGVIQLAGPLPETGIAFHAISLVAIIVAHDAWFYWTHRLIHDRRLFRRMHRTHHRSKVPTAWAAYSFDQSEAWINAIFLPIYLVLVPTPSLVIFLFLVHMIVRNALGHCGVEVYPATRDGKPLFDWMTTTTHHDLHHEFGRWNYGLYFTWWDRLMGTEHPLYHERFARSVGIPLNGSAVAAVGGVRRV
ncbi:MAG: sterol desaturase family protein [Pseudomonadota bacterium]